MKIRESAENYLETIYILLKRKGAVRAVDVADELSFSKPSVSIAMKNLRENGFITTEKATGLITLTDRGTEIASRMYERHTVLSDLFILLGVDEHTAAEDACRAEHVISAETFEALKRHARKLQKERPD